jgi:hypothetical protein
MIEGYSKETTYSEETLRDILFLIAWGGVLYLCSLTLKNYYLNAQPPLWDNLDYQQRALYILKNWLDGNSQQAFESLYAENFPAYLFSIAISFLLFGFNPFSPYLVSAFFGVGCMIAVYLLSLELGTGKRAAFWGVLAFSTLPNFIYQNFLQTRNDFPLAFFITLSWILLLRGVKQKNIKAGFFAGVMAGIGTLFKASAPGYVAWGILAFLIMPEKYIQTSLKERIKLTLLFVGGAVLSCGWHFLPHLNQILSYYTIWGNAKTWVISQYNLQANWTDHFFYIKNIIFIHIGEKIFFIIILFGGLLLIRWFIKRDTLKFTKEKSKILPHILLVILAGLTPLIFISLRQSFASVGDIPTLPLLAAGGLAFINRISWGIIVPKFILFSLLPVCLILSISNLSIIEKQFSAKDIEMLSREAMNIRKEFGLGNTPMMQVFSHPIYNANSLAWLWLMNPKMNGDFVHQPTKQYQVVFPEDGETISSKLTRFPLLILSEFPGTAIDGEIFHTLNRLHPKINSALDKHGHFLKLRSLSLEEGHFPIHFMLNKNFSVLRSTNTTIDNWTKWGGEVQYFSLKKTKLIWRAMPIRKIDSFKLVDKDNNTSFAKMIFNKILPNGKYEYQSEMVPATNKLLTLILMPESLDRLLPASTDDKRMLAFNHVETEVIKYD